MCRCGGFWIVLLRWRVVCCVFCLFAVDGGVLNFSELSDGLADRVLLSRSAGQLRSTDS